MKFCIKCNLEKDLNCFSFRSDTKKHKNTCKHCISVYNEKYQKDNSSKIKDAKHLYYENNRETIIEHTKEYQRNNPEIGRKSNIKYYKSNKDFIRAQAKRHYDSNQEKILLQKRKWFKNNKNELNKNRATKRKDPLYKLAHMISVKVNKALKLTNSVKNNSTLKVLSYSIQELKEHLENQFEPWMSWNNHGPYKYHIWNDNDSSTWTWNIDHIIPQSKLLYSSMSDENFKKCWALENLRPLSAKTNVIDGNRRK